MEEENDTITEDVAASITLGQTIYDVEGEKVGTVDDIDRTTGWFKAEVNPLSDKELHIPFKLIRSIDPKELYLSRTKDELRREYTNPPARTTRLEPIGDETVATTREASGYDGSPIVVDEANVEKNRKRIGIGYLVVTEDEVDLGNIKQYDPTTGWMLVGKTALGKNDLLLPVTVVSRVDRQFGEVHLAVSAADLQRMKHLEPVDVVFATTKPIPAGG
jgi:hypothetical protein